MRRTFNVNLFVGLGLTLLAAMALVVVAKPFIGWWAGTNVVPTTSLVIWMAAWSVINAFTNPIACLLASASHLHYQLMYSALSTVSNLGLSVYLVQHWGVAGVIAATAMSYAVFVCAPVYVDAKLLLRRLERT